VGRDGGEGRVGDRKVFWEREWRWREREETISQKLAMKLSQLAKDRKLLKRRRRRYEEIESI
tara:strand:+ start:1038 stop:1223 length:186 start_codon:yes stop_codon:yes gene_type:complete